MAASPQHTFIVKTKQAERMATLLCRPDVRTFVSDHLPSMTNKDYIDDQIRFGEWPLPNVWLGTSVTNQTDADERIPHLLRTPAAHRWVSVEPMVGPIDLTLDPRADLNALTGIVAGPDDRWPGLDLVICGGQSGQGAVPFDDDWARSLRDQCAAGVPFYFKQRSGMRPEQEPELDGVRHTALPWRGRQ